MTSKLKVKKYLFPSTNQNCGILCLECSQNDLQSCITCKPGIFDYKNKCYNNCPEGTYPDDEWQMCINCDPSCPICWGPNNDMCSNNKGIKTTAVLLENEIKEYFFKKIDKNNFFKEKKSKIFDFNMNPSNIQNETIKIFEEISNSDFNNDTNINQENKLSYVSWLNIINVILKDIDNNKIYPKNHKNKIEINNNGKEFDSTTISIEDVYGSNKVFTDLPIGSFSRKNGIFIPIPSYLDENIEIIESHWIYIKGSWLENKWIDEWVPVLPSFIKKNGEKNKIYFENEGYWIYDNRKGFFN